MFGEITNKQSANGDECFYDLDGSTDGHPPLPVPGPTGAAFTYQALLTQLGQHDIGWLAWSWWKDGCLSRQMTNTGAFADLTPHGNDLVHNGVYGIADGVFRAVRTLTLP